MSQVNKKVNNKINKKVDKLVQQEVLSLFCSQAAKVPFVIIGGSVLLVSFVFGQVPYEFTLGWLLIVVVTQLWRWRVLPQLPNATHLDIEQKVKRAAAFGLLNGVVLGLSMLFFPFIQDIDRMVISSLLISVCVGAIGTTAGYRPLFFSFSFPLMGAVISAFLLAPILWGADNLLYVVAAIYVLLQLIFIGLAKEFHQGFRFAQEASQQREQANEELSLALEAAEKANISKTRFLASASHDLRQPIHTLSLFIASLKMRLKNNENTEIVEHMHKAMSSIDNQLDSLLDISKLDSGIVEAQSSIFDVLELTRKLIELHQVSQEEGRAIEFIIECDDAAIYINKDSQLFERVLRNVIDNAIKYTSKGSIRIIFKTKGEKVHIAIEDTGIGIAPEELEKVFEEFYQTGNPERDRSRGLGLGLSIVQRLCKILDVEIKIESSLGKGTMFELICDSARGGVSKQEINLIKGQGSPERQNVLLLDNEKDILIAMKTLLVEMGHCVEAFNNAEFALTTIENKDFDLALVDYRLSAITNGVEVINEMEKVSPNTRFYLVTGDTNTSKSISDNHSAITAILYKPLTLENLKQVFIQ